MEYPSTSLILTGVQMQQQGNIAETKTEEQLLSPPFSCSTFQKCKSTKFSICIFDLYDAKSYKSKINYTVQLNWRHDTQHDGTQ